MQTQGLSLVPVEVKYTRSRSDDDVLSRLGNLLTMAQQPPMADEELEALASALQQQILNDLPIRCGISFHWNGTQEEAERVCFQLQVQSALLRHQSPWLDFTSLKSIVFHKDYEQGLRDASARVGRDIIPTREPGGLSLAMLVHAVDGCELIADVGIALGLLSPDVAHSDVSVSTLRHELCHVDDFHRKKRLWENEWLKEHMKGVRATFFPIAESLWSEYYANRVSDSPPAGAYLTGEEDMLARAMRDATQEVETAISAFRVSHDIGGLTLLASRKVSFVALSMGYVLGRYAARGLYAPRTTDLREALRASGLEDAFQGTMAELDRLFHKRDSWTSAEDLAELERIWLRVMCGFGLRFEEISPGRVYIHVPYSKPRQ